MYLIKNKVMIMFGCVNMQTFVWGFFVWVFVSQHVSLRKSAPVIVVKVLFYENINQEHNLGIPDCVLGPFTYVCRRICIWGILFCLCS